MARRRVDDLDKPVLRTEEMTALVIRLSVNCMLSATAAMALHILIQRSAAPVLFGDLLLGLLVVSFYWINVFCGPFWLFTVMHLLPYLAVYLMGGDLFVYWVRLFVMSIATLMAYRARITGERLAYPGIYLFVYAILLTLLSYQRYLPAPQLRTVSYVTACISAFLMILYANTKQLTKGLDNAASYSNVPYEKIKQTNAQMVGITMVIVTLMIGLFSVRDMLPQIAHALGQAILRFFRWLGSFLQFQEADEAGEFVDQDSSMAGLEEIMQQMTEPPRWLTIFYTVMEYILTIAVAALCLYLAYQAIRGFYRSFKASGVSAEDDEITYLKPGEKEEKVARVRQRPSFWDRSPEAQIRRAWAGAVKKSPEAKKVRESDTPMEIENATMQGAEAERVAEMHEIYERARYQGGVSMEDARRMRKISK